MSQYLNLVKYNMKVNHKKCLLFSLLVLFITPIIFGITALDSDMSAMPLEIMIPFVGVVMLTPIFSSEQDRGILDTVRSRKTSYIKICVLRIIVALITTALLILSFVFIMMKLECEVNSSHMLASMSNAIFLGSLGLFGSVISNNSVIGYMVPVSYFIINLFAGRSLGKLSLFSLMQNDVTSAKVVLIILGFLFIVISLFIKEQIDGQIYRKKT